MASSELKVGDRVVIDGPPRRKIPGVVIGPARNAAHFLIRDESGQVWNCHWAYLKKSSS